MSTKDKHVVIVLKAFATSIGAGVAPPLHPAASLSDLCNVPPGMTLPEGCALGGSLRIELTYGDVLGPLQVQRTPEIEQALKAGFHIILFWSPAAERFCPKEMNDR